MSPEPRDGFDPDELGPGDGEGESDRRLLKLVSASTVRMEQTRWAWTGRVPLGGVTLLAGQEGSGKTTILIDVLARLTRGQLDGDLRGAPVGCVYATAEDSYARTLVPRLTAAGADLKRIYFVQIDGLDGGLSIPGDLVRLAQRMRSNEARVLVLDPLGAHLDEKLDTHKDAPVRRALAPLANWMEELNAACIGVMHWSKAPTTVALDRVNGSRGFTAAARSMLAVGEDPGEDTAHVLIVAKSNLGRIDIAALRYKIEGRSVTDDEGRQISTSGVAWLGEAPGIGAHDIFSSQEDPDERTARNELDSVIKEALDGGCQDMRSLRSWIRATGQKSSDKAIQRALTRLGVKRKPSTFGGPYVFQRTRAGQTGMGPGETVQIDHPADEEGLCRSDPVDGESGRIGQSGQSGQSRFSPYTPSTLESPPPTDEDIERWEAEAELE